MGKRTQQFSLFKFLVFPLLLVFSGLLASAQTPAVAGASVVVESVEKNREADRAGLHEGDVLTGWTSTDKSGAIGSPFDLMRLERELAPRAPVSFSGYRAGESRTWRIEGEAWGLATQPLFTGPDLSLYQQGLEAIKGPAPAAGVADWRALAREANPTLAAWLGLRAIQSLADAQKLVLARQLCREPFAPWPASLPTAGVETALLCGDLAVRASDWPVAEASYQEALRLAQQSREAELTTDAVLDRLGKLAQLRSEFAAAERFYEQALTSENRLAPESLRMAQTLYDFGRLAWARGNVAASEHYHQEALALREKRAPEGLEVAASRTALAGCAWKRGELDAAQAEVEHALQIQLRLAAVSVDAANSLNILGLVNIDRGNLPQAEEYLLKSLHIRQELQPDSLQVANSLNNLAVVIEHSGDPARSEQYYRQSLSLREKLVPGSLDLAETLHNLGIVVWERGDLQEAQRFELRALEIKLRVAPESISIATTLEGLASLAKEQGDYPTAMHYLKRSLAIHKKQASHKEMAITLSDLGDLAQLSGHPFEASDYYHQALVIDREAGATRLEVAEDLDDLGRVRQKLGDLVGAKALFRQAFAINSRIAPDGLGTAASAFNLGEAHWAEHDWAGAENWFRSAVVIQEKQIPGSLAEAESLAALGRVLLAQHQPETAGPLLERAIDALESQSVHLGGSERTRSEFRAKYRGYYRDYIELLLSQKQDEKALEILERSRARTSLEILTEGRLKIRNGADPKMLDQEHTLAQLIRIKTERRLQLLNGEHQEKQLATLNTELAGLLSEYASLEGMIRTVSPRYAAVTQPEPLTAREIQERLLDPETILLEYLLDAHHGYLWVVSQTLVRSQDLGDAAKIRAAASEVYRLLTTRNRAVPGETLAKREARARKADAAYPAAALRLSRLILGPVTSEIRGKRLLMVNDGVLHYIPFAALPDPDSAHSAPLVVGHEIVSLPSASMLAAMGDPKPSEVHSTNAVAVFADPVFDSSDPRVQKRLASHKSQSPSPRLVRSAVESDGAAVLRLDRLWFSREEAEMILKVAPATSWKALDFAANRAAATDPALRQYPILHFATHAILDNEHPELSGLVLSLVNERGQPQNGFLSLQDIYNLDLPAELVVLSACQTALGKEVDGEGLVGLTRAFLYAGAERVVASLWSVSDSATAELMGAFYRNMLEQGMRPAAALRQAQIEMWKKGQSGSPYYWAGFVLQGKWQ